MILSARLVGRVRNEVPNGDDGFFVDSVEEEFLNAAKYLKGTLKASDDDIVNMLHGLYDAMAEEYGA